MRCALAFQTPTVPADVSSSHYKVLIGTWVLFLHACAP